MENTVPLEVYVQLRQQYDNERQKVEILTTLAMKDALTGVDNRRALDEKLIQQVAEARRARSKLIIIMFDVDHFKEVNDKYGHIHGDNILKKLASVVSETKRPEDILARYGGEEFVLIFPEQASTDLSHFSMERYQKAIAQINRSPNNDGQELTVSFGTVIVDFSNEDPKNQDQSINAESLMEQADSLLYSSKKEGRNRLTLAYRTAK